MFTDLSFGLMVVVQEAIFDSLGFAFVADCISRLKSSLEQIFIARSTVKFVEPASLIMITDEEATKMREQSTSLASS